MMKAVDIYKPNIKTNCGIMVRSQPEVIIADTLYDRKIKFEYEKRLELDEQTVHPDFYLTDYNIYMEYFGLMYRKDYKKSTERKLLMYKENNITCIELFEASKFRLIQTLSYELNKLQHYFGRGQYRYVGELPIFIKICKQKKETRIKRITRKNPQWSYLEDCMIFLNRDINENINILTRFMRRKRDTVEERIQQLVDQEFKINFSGISGIQKSLE